MNLRSLVVRTLTGVVYVLLLVGCTVYSPVSAFFFFAVVAAATLWEFGTLMNTHLEARMPRPINAMAGVVLVAAVWLSAIASPQTAQMFALYGLLMLYIIISGLYRHSKNPLQDWALCFASQLYIALPFALLPLLSIVYDETTGSMAYNWIYPLALFIFLHASEVHPLQALPPHLTQEVVDRKHRRRTLHPAGSRHHLALGQWSIRNG